MKPSMIGQRTSPFDGITTSGTLTDFAAVIRQKRELVEALRHARYADVIADDPNIAFVRGRGVLVDARTIEVNGERLHGDAILLCTGARPAVPEIAGLQDVPFLTNESAFELSELPDSLLVLGGRYIALECAQLFARLGSRVTILQRSSRILPQESATLTDQLTRQLESERLRVVTDVAAQRVSAEPSAVAVEAIVRGRRETFRASWLLVATGRTPNANGLRLEHTAVKTDVRGFVSVDEYLQTTASGVYAAGDLIGEPMFVYTAAYEGALATENALTGSTRQRDYTALPWVVFVDPQVAGVGLDLEQAKAEGLDAEASTLPLAQVPRAIAARDTRGFIQLIRDRHSDRLIGARILAPEGGELLMEAAVAIRHGITVAQLATMFHPYLTLSEGIKLSALSFGKDVKKLSCCAA